MLIGTRDAGAERLVLDELRSIASKHGMEVQFFVPEEIIKAEYKLDRSECQSPEWYTMVPKAAKFHVDLQLADRAARDAGANHLNVHQRFYPCITSDNPDFVLMGHSDALLDYLRRAIDRQPAVPCHDDEEDNSAFFCKNCKCGHLIPVYSDEFLRQRAAKIASHASGSRLRDPELSRLRYQPLNFFTTLRERDMSTFNE